jgi:hypothetical protein
MLLARELVAWGETRQVLDGDNLQKARDFRETWEEDAPWCDLDTADPPNWQGPRNGADSGDRIVGDRL